jgi:hypothetical protein
MPEKTVSPPAPFPQKDPKGHLVSRSRAHPPYPPGNARARTARAPRDGCFARASTTITVVFRSKPHFVPFDVRVRQLLKVALRTFAFEAVQVAENPPSPPSRPREPEFQPNESPALALIDGARRLGTLAVDGSKSGATREASSGCIARVGVGTLRNFRTPEQTPADESATPVRRHVGGASA